MNHRKLDLFSLAWEFIIFPIFVVAVLFLLGVAAKDARLWEGATIGNVLATYGLGRMFTLLYPMELLLKRYLVVNYEGRQIRSVDLTDYRQDDFNVLWLATTGTFFLFCLTLWLASMVTRWGYHWGYPLALGVLLYLIVGAFYTSLRFAPRVRPNNREEPI